MSKKILKLGRWDRFAIAMLWSSNDEFDLLAVLEHHDGSKEIIYFSELGSETDHPYLRLVDEIDFSSLGNDSEERILIEKWSIRRLWLFGWCFGGILEGESLDFSKSGLRLEFRHQEERSLSTVPVNSIGNFCRLGLVQQDSTGEMSFESKFDCFTVQPFEEIEEILAYSEQ